VLLGAGLAATAAALTGCTEERKPTWSAAPTATPSSPAPAGPRAAAGASPRAKTAAPYAEAVEDVLTRYLKPTRDNPRHPGYAGAVALVTVDGRTTLHTAVGHAVRYRAGPVELPAGRRVVMRPDAIFDLASITKVYTAVMVLHLADRGRVDLDAPVRRYLPEFTGAGKSAVTVAMLLAHTGALPVGAKVTNGAGWRSVLATPLVEGGTPGTTFRYSSVGLMVLGRLVEKLTGRSLDKALRDIVTTPLGWRTPASRR
jgi:CubicO group peptidase (beta-lactamase class C family)